MIFGNIAQPPDAVNVARVAALRAGVPRRVPAFTVNRLCGSGLQSIVDAHYRIAAGDAEAILAGGVESMSNIPFLYSRESQEVFTEVFTARDLATRVAAAAKFRPRHFKPEIGLQMGLTDAVCGLNMGETAEVLAKEHGISREEQDAFALRSHQRVTLARDRSSPRRSCRCPIPPKFEGMATQDNGVRENQTSRGAREAQALLRPEVRHRHRRQLLPDHRRRRRDARHERVGRAGPGATRRSAASADSRSARSSRSGWGWAPRSRRRSRSKRAGLAWKDIGLVEINEAFAAQVLACARVFPSAAWHAKYHTDGPIGEIDWEKTNVNGGAIALGHPVGSSANRLVTTLLKEMRRRGTQFGLATMCIGGGQGGAVVLEQM